MSPIESLICTPVHQAIARSALCCALALAGIAQAAPTHASAPMDPPDTYAPGPDDSGAPAQGPRSIFLGTIAAMVAQSVGKALAQGIGSSITHWFVAQNSGKPNTKPPHAQRADKPARAKAPPLQADEPAQDELDVRAIGRDGVARAIDTTTHRFRTGDRFEVHYRATQPGHIKVFNVAPGGKESRIDSVETARGRLAVLGPYRFVDRKGEETLKLVLQPCDASASQLASRAIVKDGSAPQHPAAHGCVPSGQTRETRIALLHR